MLVLDENGKVTNMTNKSVDELKRESYKHSSQESVLKEEAEEISSFVDNLEELEDGEDSPSENNLNPEAVEIAILYAEFKANFAKVFGEEELEESFSQFEEFFKERGVDVSLDLAGLEGEPNIPGLESSEQSIISSEIEPER
jgi:tyrosyl-tRNA synthetase